MNYVWANSTPACPLCKLSIDYERIEPYEWSNYEGFPYEFLADVVKGANELRQCFAINGAYPISRQLIRAAQYGDVGKRLADGFGDHVAGAPEKRREHNDKERPEGRAGEALHADQPHAEEGDASSDRLHPVRPLAERGPRDENREVDLRLHDERGETDGKALANGDEQEAELADPYQEPVERNFPGWNFLSLPIFLTKARRYCFPACSVSTSTVIPKSSQRSSNTLVVEGGLVLQQ